MVNVAGVLDEFRDEVGVAVDLEDVFLNARS
jgi:hypothetical protein